MTEHRTLFRYLRNIKTLWKKKILALLAIKRFKTCQMNGSYCAESKNVEIPAN